MWHEEQYHTESRNFSMKLSKLWVTRFLFSHWGAYNRCLSSSACEWRKKVADPKKRQVAARSLNDRLLSPPPFFMWMLFFTSPHQLQTFSRQIPSYRSKVDQPRDYDAWSHLVKLHCGMTMACMNTKGAVANFAPIAGIPAWDPSFYRLIDICKVYWVCR